MGPLFAYFKNLFGWYVLVPIWCTGTLVKRHPLGTLVLIGAVVWVILH